MNSSHLTAPLCAALLLSASCASERPSASELDQGVPDTPDMAMMPDQASSPDQGSSACAPIEIVGEFALTYSDDVSIEYTATISPPIEGKYATVTLLFERYTPGADIGTFALGAGGPEESFGGCAHCVFLKGDSPDEVYFASAGTLITRADPYARSLDVTLEGVEFVPSEVDPMTRATTPIPGGMCVALDTHSAKKVFPLDGWSCAAERYMDGQRCDCECGALDPDCYPPGDCLPGDPSCPDYTPLPIMGCEAQELCLFDPETWGSICTASCDWQARSGCASGTCVYDFGLDEGDTCIEGTARVVGDVRVGEMCPRSLFQLFCDVVDGFSTGYCDPNHVCRAVCRDDAECTEPGHTCRKFFHDDGFGYCGPEPVDEDG